MKINDIQFGSLWAIVFLVNLLGYLFVSLLAVGAALLGDSRYVSFNGRPVTDPSEAVLATLFMALGFVITTAIGSLVSALLFRALRSVMPKLELRVDTSKLVRSAFE